MFNIRFLCDRPGTASIEMPQKLGSTTAWGDLRKAAFLAGDFRAIQGGLELCDSDVPSPDHDIFIVVRTTSPSAAAGRCSPPTTAAVEFREPGKRAFKLELPMNSSLASVKAALLNVSGTSREEREGGKEGGRCRQPRRRQERQELPPEEKVVAEVGTEDSTRDCTLILAGSKMSDSCLLGDYLIKRSAIVSRRSGRPVRRRPAPILVLWHPPPQATTQQDTPTAVAQAHCPPSYYPRAFAALPAATRATATTKTEAASRWPRLDHTLSRGAPAAAAAADSFTCPTPPRKGSQEVRGCGDRRRSPSRRSVQRRCKTVVRYSGLQRGARGGLGIRPLS